MDNVSNGKAALYVDAGAEAILSGGTFERSKETGYKIDGVDANPCNSWYTIYNDGIMTINAGTTVKNLLPKTGTVVDGASSMMINGAKSDALITINGGTFIGGLNTVKNDEKGTAIVKGGEFRNTAQATFMNWNIATVNGGTFNCDYENFVNGTWTTDGMTSGGKLTINGGTFNNKTGLVSVYYNSKYVDDVPGFGAIKIADGIEGQVIAPTGAALTGEISFGNNKITFDAAQAGSAVEVSSGSAIKIEGSIVDGTGVATMEVGGKAEISGAVTLQDVDLTIGSDASLIVDAGATLAIGEGSTVEVKKGATMSISKDSSVSSTGTGKIVVESSAKVNVSGTLDATTQNSGTIYVSTSGTVSSSKISGSGTTRTESVFIPPKSDDDPVVIVPDAEDSDDGEDVKVIACAAAACVVLILATFVLVDSRHR